jgi:hypothetical protein
MIAGFRGDAEQALWILVRWRPSTRNGIGELEVRFPGLAVARHLASCLMHAVHYDLVAAIPHLEAALRLWPMVPAKLCVSSAACPDWSIRGDQRQRFNPLFVVDFGDRASREAVGYLLQWVICSKPGEPLEKLRVPPPLRRLASGWRLATRNWRLAQHPNPILLIASCSAAGQQALLPGRRPVDG